jgi:NADPH-dependent curcumin reductase CurA
MEESMSKNSEDQPGLYPLLEALLKEKGLALKGIYKYKDAAEIFGASVRTIQQWVRDGKLRCRDLPARGRFLSEDLEAFLRNSDRGKNDGHNDKGGR